MRTTVGTLWKVSLVLLLAVSAVGTFGNVARAATICNVPRIPRTDQEEATYKPESTTAMSMTRDFSLLARGRSEDRESPTVPAGPYTFSGRFPVNG